MAFVEVAQFVLQFLNHDGSKTPQPQALVNPREIPQEARKHTA